MAVAPVTPCRYGERNRFSIKHLYRRNWQGARVKIPLAVTRFVTPSDTVPCKKADGKGDCVKENDTSAAEWKGPSGHANAGMTVNKREIVSATGKR